MGCPNAEINLQLITLSNIYEEVYVMHEHPSKSPFFNFNWTLFLLLGTCFESPLLLTVKFSLHKEKGVKRLCHLVQKVLAAQWYYTCGFLETWLHNVHCNACLFGILTTASMSH